MLIIPHHHELIKRATDKYARPIEFERGRAELLNNGTGEEEKEARKRDDVEVACLVPFVLPIKVH